jgi:hypothetical protein
MTKYPIKQSFIYGGMRYLKYTFENGFTITTPRIEPIDKVGISNILVSLLEKKATKDILKTERVKSKRTNEYHSMKSEGIYIAAIDPYKVLESIERDENNSEPVLIINIQGNATDNIKDLMRQTGRTTRLADEAIQTLFKEGKVIVKDHADTKAAQNDLFYRVSRRLDAEHGGMSRFIFDRPNLTITRKTGQRTIQHK